MRILGWLLIALPFAFGATRALTTNGDDMRYIFVATGALLGVFVVSGRPVRHARLLRVTLIATVVGAIAAAVVGYLQGGRSPASVALVSVAFAACIAGGSYVLRHAPHHRHA